MRGKAVIISEDEDEIRKLLAVMFESEGYTVYQATDGIEALELVRAHVDDVLLLVTDLGLPRLGGLELIREARALIPTLGVIAASGYGHMNVRSELRNIGVEDFFPKPFSPIELLETAHRLLTSH
jgi:DNA-binding response OmpR family regulator